MFLRDVFVWCGEGQSVLFDGIVVPRTVMRVDMVAHVSPDPSDKEVILGTDVHIEYLRIVRRETEQTPVVIVGAICKLGQQILGDLSALGEPAVELRPLHV